MLSLWKLRVGAEAYYLSQVASGLDDYYSGEGETAGRWVGAASHGLGLDGEVSGEDLRALLAGLAPGTGLTPNGTRLRAHPRRVPGFDLTFSVPKSVSVAYALGDPLVQAAIVHAAEAAVADAIAWLEREACHVRRGTNRQDAKGRVADWGTRRMPGAGFVAAQFAHRTSRAGDPQLHWHVLVANTTKGPDGRWSALDATGIYRSQRVAGVIFQAALRRQLTDRLGVGWTPPIRDACEIAGIPRRILRLFSKRRVEIQAELDRLGASGPKAAEAATLATRRAKSATDANLLVARWQREADGAGWGPTDLDRLLATRASSARPNEHSETATLAASHEARLIDHEATFTLHDAAAAIASALPNGATAAEVERLVAGVLANDATVGIRPETTARPLAGWEVRNTTRTHIALEMELREAIASGVASSVGVLTPDVVGHACATTSLADDQVVALTRLCTQGNGVEVLVGRAGSGKTHTMAGIRAAYSTAGWRVLGVAPSARAARELESGAGIASFTVPRFDRHVSSVPLATPTVVIVDEAGMCGTVDLHRVVTSARRVNAKVILVGDPRQLPEVLAGGGLAAAIDQLGTQVCELTTNRRQSSGVGDRRARASSPWRRSPRMVVVRQPWSCSARRRPDIAPAWAVDDWWEATAAGRDALLLAGTRSEAHALNRLARQRAADGGSLGGPELRIADRAFQKGDRVLFCRNDARQQTLHGGTIRVDNGMLGRVSLVHLDAGTLDVELRGGVTVRVTAEYLADGHLDHGYAMTIHKSQGATCDDVFVVGPAGLYREAAYVALSRARDGATVYATVRDAVQLGEPHHARGLPLPGEDRGLDADVVTAIERSQAKSFASDDDPGAIRVANLARNDLATLSRRLACIRGTEARLRGLGLTDPEPELAALARARFTRAHLAEGRRVRALDRTNVGTVIEITDATGSTSVLFCSEDGATAVRHLPWSELKPIDHAPLVDVAPDARAWLDREGARLDHAAAAWSSALAEYGLDARSASDVERAIEARRDLVARRVHADPPEWLTWWIGERPSHPDGARTWDGAVGLIAEWRDRHGVSEVAPGLGPLPVEEGQQWRWYDAMSELLKRRQSLAAYEAASTPIRLSSVSPSEAHDRLAELEALFAQAPSDQRRIIDDLTTGRTTTDALEVALDAARRSQTDRDRWILANWPYVVEHQELLRVVDREGPFAAWPRAVPQGVTDALDRLAAELPEESATESQTLAELDAALQTLDPASELRTLSERLVGIDDRLLAVGRDADEQADASRRALLEAEHDTLAAERNQVAVEAERALAAVRDMGWHSDAVDLREAVVRRTDFVYRQAVLRRPEWLVDMLADLDEKASLSELSGNQVRQIVLEATTARDRDEQLMTDIKALSSVGTHAMRL